jgi:hypothetical protein
MPKSCDVIYMNMGTPSGLESNMQQAIYKNFTSFMSFILKRLPDDLKRNTGDEFLDKFWMYGFIKALMELLVRFKGELKNLPADLSRVRVQVGKPKGLAAGIFEILPASLFAAKNAIYSFENQSASSRGIQKASVVLRGRVHRSG